MFPCLFPDILRRVSKGFPNIKKMSNYFAIGAGAECVAVASVGLVIPHLAYWLLLSPEYAQRAEQSTIVSLVFAAHNVFILALGFAYAFAALTRGQRRIYIPVAGCCFKVLLALLVLIGWRMGVLNAFATVVSALDVVLGVLAVKWAFFP